jgi:hypothetical protein
VGAQAQAQAGFSDGRQVGAVQVFLAEVNAIGTGIDGVLPMVID